MTSLVEMIEEGEEQMKSVSEAFRVLKDCKALQTQADSGERRKLTLAIGRTLKQLKVAGNDFPRSLQTWAGEVLFNMTQESKELTVRASKTLVERSSTRDWCETAFLHPLFWADDSECIVKHAFADIINAYNGRVPSVVVKVHDRLATEPEGERCIVCLLYTSPSPRD